MGVAEVVNPDAVNACEVCELLHRTRKPCLCGRKPVVAQYELAVRDDNALHLAPCGEFGKRVLIQIDGADCRTRLRFRELVVRLVVVVERFGDGTKPGREVDIAPQEGRCFPKPHPTHEQEEQADEQVVLVVVSLVEFGKHLLELLKRPEVHKRFLPTNVADHP